MKNKKTPAHKPWTITAKAGDEIEILLYEMIGEDWFGEGTTAKSFAEDLKAAGKVSKIHLRVNSPGGNVFDGIAIYNTLLSHGAKITAAVDGIAASIASVIVMAAEEISMNDNAMMMIHNPSTMIGGDAPRMRKMADTLDKIKSSMITAYRRHSDKSVEEIGALLDAETWMTAQETVDSGFAESVTTPEGEEADVAANFDLSHFRKVPVQIAAVFGAKTITTAPAPPRAADMCACDCTACMKDDCANCDDPDCEDPNCDGCPMQEAAAKASAAAQAVTTQIEDLRAQLKAAEDRAKTAKNLAAETATKLEQSELARKHERADHSKWMQRVSGELAESAKLYKSSTAELTKRCEAAEAIQATLLPRIDAAEKLLTNLKAERSAEMAAFSKWTERVVAELKDSAKLNASALAEIQRRLHMASSAEPSGTSIEALEVLLSQLKAQRTYESTAQAKWIERVSGELDQSSKLYAAIGEEIQRRARMAEVAGEVGLHMEAAETTLADLKASVPAKVSAEPEFIQATADLKRAGEIYGSAIEEMGRRSRLAALTA